jgi:hypothetical protein
VSDYEREHALVGGLADLDHSEGRAVVRPRGGTVADVHAMFDRIRTENAAEPLWQGVVSTTATEDGLVFEFAPASEVPLRQSGATEVACVLYPPEDAP